jgi:hypothetical protein
LRVPHTLFISLFLVFAAFADVIPEARKIESLLSNVEKLEAVFIRNGKEYPPKEAADHLRSKLKAAQNSIFAPSKDKWTAKLFIEKVASKSSSSGKPYQIKFADGKIVNAGEWLTQKLKDIEASGS